LAPWTNIPRSLSPFRNQVRYWKMAVASAIFFDLSKRSKVGTMWLLF